MNSDIQEINNEETPLTEPEIWDIIKFARALSVGNGLAYLNPELVSARLRDINLNPVSATQETLDRALLDPKNNEKQIQEFSQSFELTSAPYKRLLSYLGDMLAFDITYSSTNAKAKDYTSPAYKKSIGVVETFLDRFDYKKEFRMVTKEMLRNDAYFGCIRDTGERIILQELPNDYCKITGRWSNGFLFSFNMYWFLLPGVDLDMYPPFFKKKFKEIWGDHNTTQKYDPALPPESRSASTWIYWVDVPVDVGWCFKLNSELASRLPYFTPLFSDLLLQGLMRNLQKNINMSVASRLLLGEVPMLNKEAKATVKDSFAISPDLLGKFMGLVKSAIATESVKFASAPLTNMQGVSFPAENEVYDSYLRTTLATSGVNSNLIFSSNIKPNAIETQLSLNVDEQLMYVVYPQFNDFLDYQINQISGQFKFSCELEGTEFFTNRNKRIEDAMTLFAQGIVLPHKIAAAIGMKPSALRRHMEESKATGFMDLLTPPMALTTDMQTEQQLTIADKQAENQVKVAKQLPKPTITGGAKPAASKPKVSAPAKVAGDKGGRPAKKDSSLSDNGAETRASGGNISRGGKK